MPRSITVSLLAALAGATAFSFYSLFIGATRTQADDTSVALAFFNASAVLCLFVILYRNEHASHEQFGRIIRANISTIIVALLIDLIGTVVNIGFRFGA